jgi:hypothetical protein
MMTGSPVGRVFWPFGLAFFINSSSLSEQGDSLVEFTAGYLFAQISVDQHGNLWVERFRRLQGRATLFH